MSRTKKFPVDSLWSALAASISSGTFTDTAYHLYSRRLPSGKIGAPRIVHANSRVLKAAGEYFVAQLDGGFAIDQQIPTDTDAYGYDDDSDIEDAEDLPDSDGFLDVITADTASGSGNSKGKQVSAEEEPTTTSEPVEYPNKNIKYTVVVPDVAATTWHALIYYVYTGAINFAPLRSQGVAYRTQQIVEHHEKNPDHPVLCSPKSMYRLADIVGLDDLKLLAKNDIQRKMSAHTVVNESFSHFSSTYFDILTMQLEILYDDSLISRVMPTIQERLRAVVDGRLPHTENVMAALIAKLSTLLVGLAATERPKDSEGALQRNLEAKFDSGEEGDPRWEVVTPREQLKKKRSKKL